MIYTVEVTWTDRSRTPDGGYRQYTSTVEVMAETDAEASLVACQMVHAIRADLDPMVLGSEILSAEI